MPAYKVEIEREGCAHCKSGTLWRVVGPDDMAQSVMYEREEDALDLCTSMNEAYEAGILRGKITMSNYKADHIPADAITARDPYKVVGDLTKWLVVERRDNRPRSAHFDSKILALEVCTSMNESFGAGVAAAESGLVDAIYAALMRIEGKAQTDKLASLIRKALPGLGYSAQEKQAMRLGLHKAADDTWERIFSGGPDQDKGDADAR